MHKSLGSALSLPHRSAYASRDWLMTQAHSDRLELVQADTSSGQVAAKLRADHQGNCNPKPPNAKTLDASAQKQPKP